MADNWLAAIADLHDTLALSGVSEAIVERVLTAVAPAYVAIERERGDLQSRFW